MNIFEQVAVDAAEHLYLSDVVKHKNLSQKETTFIILTALTPLMLAKQQQDNLIKGLENQVRMLKDGVEGNKI
jgi:hypothetical protein